LSAHVDPTKGVGSYKQQDGVNVVRKTIDVGMIKSIRLSSKKVE